MVQIHTIPAAHSCTASRKASQCAVTSKKGVIGIGVPKHLHDVSRGLYFAESAAFLSAPSVYGGSDGGAKAPPVLAGGARYANPSELPPSIGVGGGGFCKPHLLEDAMSQTQITSPEALQHINAARAKLQKALAALAHEHQTAEHLQSALGQALSAGRSLKRASEVNKSPSNGLEG